MYLTVFSDDWGRHPSSCQHLVRQLLDRHCVRWVNTIGTRRPSFDFYSLKRSLEKINAWLALRRDDDQGVNANPAVLAPFMLPSFGSRLSRHINASLLTRSLSEKRENADESVAVTTLPVTADIVGRLPVSRWVYYCVDDLSEWPGLDKTVLERMERELLDKVDAVITVSENLKERVRKLGRNSSLLTHGVDTQLWRQLPKQPSKMLAQFQAPYIIFWGVVDQRLDLDCIERLSQSLKTGSLIFAGPDNNPDPRLRELNNVHLIGPVDYEELPRLATAASVLMMPYRDAPVTRAMQPLKLMEYLSTGKPVVCRDLPAVEMWREACHVYRTADEFVSNVQAGLCGAVPPTQTNCRQKLVHQGWANNALEFERVLLGHAMPVSI